MTGAGGTMWLPIAVRVARQALKKSAGLLREKLASVSALQSSRSELQPVLARLPSQQPIHPIARLRQGQSRGYSTQNGIRASLRYDSVRNTSPGRPSFLSSRTGNAVRQLTTRAPFSSTLRPNLTGGSLSRTSGGYAVGAGRYGGQRYFSHTPATPAQVVSNVSIAIRSFLLSGQKARFDGTDPTTRRHQYRSVSVLQDQIMDKMRSLPRTTPGAYIDFAINPTITALSPLDAFSKKGAILDADGLLDTLAVDFARALKDHVSTLTDLRKLAGIGCLPVMLADASTIRVQFPGYDAGTVEALCLDIGVQRGLVREDDDFEAFYGTEVALQFPFAPDKSPPDVSSHDATIPAMHRDWFSSSDLNWQSTRSLGPSAQHSFSHHNDFQLFEGGWGSSSSSGMSESDLLDIGRHVSESDSPGVNSLTSASDFEGVAGVYRFWEEAQSSRY